MPRHKHVQSPIPIRLTAATVVLTKASVREKDAAGYQPVKAALPHGASTKVVDQTPLILHPIVAQLTMVASVIVVMLAPPRKLVKLMDAVGLLPHLQADYSA